MASSTEGSSTITGWKRRSRAGSFSIYFRYSSRVVAPIQCNSPRASIGFNIFPASIAPSDFPAPTMVCSSSINRMMFPSLFLTSSRTAFRRSSNSPRYLEPAIIPGRSSTMIRLSFMLSGTIPSAICLASPSTIAVLPTPGSPTRHGLFLVRLLRISMLRAISFSRPITGSSFPSLASCVRSVLYWSIIPPTVSPSF